MLNPLPDAQIEPYVSHIYLQVSPSGSAVTVMIHTKANHFQAHYPICRVAITATAH